MEWEPLCWLYLTDGLVQARRTHVHWWDKQGWVDTSKEVWPCPKKQAGKHYGSICLWKIAFSSCCNKHRWWHCWKGSLGFLWLSQVHWIHWVICGEYLTGKLAIWTELLLCAAFVYLMARQAQCPCHGQCTHPSQWRDLWACWACWAAWCIQFHHYLGLLLTVSPKVCGLNICPHTPPIWILSKKPSCR